MAIIFLYLQTLEFIALHAVPVVILTLSARRFLISLSFNRVLYAVVVLNAIGALIVVSRMGTDDAVLNALSRVVAYGCLPLWLIVTDVCRSTGSSEFYGDGWSTIYRNPAEAPPLAETGKAKIDDPAWANPPTSPAQAVVPFTPSGQAAATTVVPGTA